MNDRARLLARKRGAACGYKADGGKVTGKIPGVDGSLPKKHEVGDDLRKEPPAGVVRAADGGIIGSVSGAIERVGRTFGTEKGKALKAADAAMAPTPRPAPRADVFGRAKRLEEQEREAVEGKR